MNNDQPYILLFTECVACEKPIIAHRHFAPSLRLEDGLRYPLCKSCFSQWNKIHRTDKGLKPEILHPLAYSPEAMYDEPFH